MGQNARIQEMQNREWGVDFLGNLCIIELSKENSPLICRRRLVLVTFKNADKD